MFRCAMYVFKVFSHLFVSVFSHKMRSFAILLTAKQAVHKMRVRQGAEEFHKQIAALTIQLAWRKYIRYSEIIILYRVSFFVFFSVRLLSVLRDHSVFSSPPQQPMTSDFEGFLSQILSITFFVLSLFFRKSQYFPF